MAGTELAAEVEVALTEVTLPVDDAREVGLTAPFCKFGVEVGAFELAVAAVVADAVTDVVLATHLPDLFFTFRFCLDSVLLSASGPARCFLKSRLEGLTEPTKRWALRCTLEGWRASISPAERSTGPNPGRCKLEVANTLVTATRAVTICLSCILGGLARLYSLLEVGKGVH